jgi:3-oxoacyl-[acyl-carrier protein] reductase
MSNFLNLTGKVALVTGASTGIGAATAIALAEQGAVVAINYHQSEAAAAKTRQRILEAGGKAIIIQADVTKRDDVRRLVEQTAAELGPIDILVNNAGSLIERLKFLDITQARWDEVYDLNVKSVFHCCQAVVPSMIERKTGAIINVSSIAGRNGGAPGSIHYSSAKGALITFTKGLAKELAPHGIRVNAVSPGVIDTPYHERFSTPEAMRAFAANIPIGRVGASPEVARVIVFLASDGASYLVGETIEINGGMLML